MLPQLVKRLKDNRLADTDIEAIAQILLDRQAILSTASGAASTVVSGNAENSVIAPVVLNIDGCDPIALSDALVPQLGLAIGRLLPGVLNNLPKVGADFTGRVEEERTIVAALSREGGALTISALKGIGGVGKTALAVKIAHRLIACFRPRNCSSIGAARAKPPSPRVRRWRASSAASIRSKASGR